MPGQINILILKTGAAGDVVRTTCLLQYFRHGSITWLTDSACLPLFALDNHSNLKVYPIDNFPEDVLSTNFQLILSLEEDEFCAKLAGSLQCDKLTGIYWDNGLVYTKDAAGWFDMSLVSVYERDIANDMKRANTASFQDHLFAMLKVQFNGEPYSIQQPITVRHPRLIGIEKTAGHRWPNKTWHGYDALSEMLQEKGYETIFFGRYNDLQHYMQEVSNCRLLISGDTLAMHLAMAFKIPVIGIFNCTSPAEIFDYGFLLKLTSPRLDDFFYTTSYDQAAISAISTETVMEAVEFQWQKYYPAPNQIKVPGSF